jgi:hypothetical protein
MTPLENASFGAKFWKSVKEPDGYDLGGGVFTSIEQRYKQFGELVGKLNSRKLDGVAVDWSPKLTKGAANCEQYFP